MQDKQGRRSEIGFIMDKIRSAKKLDKKMVADFGGTLSPIEKDMTPSYTDRVRDKNVKTSMNVHHNYFWSKGPINMRKSKEKPAQIIRTLKGKVKPTDKEVPLIIERDPQVLSEEEEGVLDIFTFDDINNENSSRKNVKGYEQSDMEAEKRLR